MHLSSGILLKLLHNSTDKKSVLVSCIRWRKPLWAPRAKTKLFKIREDTPQPPEERARLKRLYDLYRTNMKSIRQHLAEDIDAKEREKEYGALAVEDEAEEKRIMTINEEWNATIAKDREIYLALSSINNYEELQMNKEKLQKLSADERSKREEELIILKERAPSFITMETLDEEINNLLDSEPVSYNYAIDKDGSKLFDNKETPPDLRKQQLSS